MKLGRVTLWKPTPLLDRDGRPFQYGMPDPVLEQLHYIDRNASGQIDIGEEVTNPSTRTRYIVNSLMEEAITSSQLEGATTTREVAQDMIRSGRDPRDRSERMILNNYLAMNRIRDLRNARLTAEIVFELHRILTEGTLDHPDAAGRFRRPDEAIAVWDERTKQVLHQPPPAEELEERLAKMCDFANATERFMHPVIRAIILHFWLAYDHPFYDGNGRTARALFYWLMLREGYWLAEYISISAILKRAPVKYGRAFLYVETDDNDLTYFVLSQLRVIRSAIDGLRQYLMRKVEEVRETQVLLRQSDNLNHRQLALLSHAIRNPGFEYSIRSHRASHGVVYETARADLLHLVELGFLNKRTSGNSYRFIAPADLHRRLKAAGADATRDS
jgi:Fic family protein